MQMKKKNFRLNNFIAIYSLCDFQVTAAYNVRTSVYENKNNKLSVELHKTVRTWR